LDKEFRVEADTSNYATGGVLSIKCSNEIWRLVAFISKSLSDTKRNYEIHDKEMLAIVRCLEVWRHFLEGVTVKFEVLSYDRKYLFNNIISFIFYIITNFSLLNSCCLLL